MPSAVAFRVALPWGIALRQALRVRAVVVGPLSAPAPWTRMATHPPSAPGLKQKW